MANRDKELFELVVVEHTVGVTVEEFEVVVVFGLFFREEVFVFPVLVLEKGFAQLLEGLLGAEFGQAFAEVYFLVGLVVLGHREEGRVIL